MHYALEFRKTVAEFRPSATEIRPPEAEPRPYNTRGRGAEAGTVVRGTGTAPLSGQRLVWAASREV
ncbi:MAG: hypothetical protein LBD24_01910 [Spirochaetaceae bacterium]|nr:hypothetical protein [Spirochaetaceae bacterium]